MGVQETILKYKVDSASQKQAEASLASVAGAGVKANKAIESSAIQTESMLTKTYKDQRDAVGDLSTSFGALGSVTSAFGDQLGGVTEGFRIAGDSLGFAEYIPNLADGIKTLGKSAFDSVGIIGTMAQGIGAAVPALAGASAGFLAIGLAAAPFVAVGIALAGVFTLMAQEAEDAKKSAERALGFAESSAEAQVKAQQLIRDGNIKGLQEAEKSSKDELQLLYARQDAVKGLFNEAKSLGKDTAVFQTRLDELNNEIYDANLVHREYSSALNGSEAQLLLTTSAVVDNTEAEKAHADALKMAEGTLKQLDSVMMSIADSDASRQLGDTREAQDTLIASAREFQDLLTDLADRYADHKGELEKIEADGNARIQALRDETARKASENATRLATLTSDYYKKIADDTSKFQLSQIRSQEDYQLRVRRAEQDFRTSQIEAIINNDASAFLRNKREFETTTTRGSEDKAIEDKRRQEDFANQQAENALRFETQKAELDKELNAFIEAQANKVREEQIAIETRLQSEKDAYQASLDDFFEKRNLAQQREDEDFTLSRKRRDEDRAIEDTKRAEQLTTILSQMDLKYVTELGYINKIIEASGKVTALLGGGVQTQGVNPQSALPAPSAGGIVVNVGAVGEITTPTVLNDALNAIVNAVSNGIQKAKLGK